MSGVPSVGSSHPARRGAAASERPPLSEPPGVSGAHSVRSPTASERHPTRVERDAELAEAGPGEAAWGPPAEFDDYVVRSSLGRGAMGAVYLAEDKLLARHVAIKFVRAPVEDEAAREWFLNEARAVARIHHPNVIGIYRVGELEGRPYLVTEFARGEPLDRLPVPLPWPRVLAIGIDLARGLGAAHRRGLLHCDIKPQNAILTDEGTKLVDFGLARLAPGHADPGPLSGGPASGTGAVVWGTPHFMAPELWRREAPTTRTDVYAAGTLLFYLASGVCPFEAVPADALWRHLRSHDAPPLRQLAPDFDGRLAAIIDRCLRRDPLERFASGDELREALEQLARHAASGPPPAGNPYRGLRPFDAEHRALFFGRDAEVGVALDRLRAEPWLVVTGDSGVGKSSVCRAGVLPAVAQGALGGGRAWSVLTFAPGKRPYWALVNALSSLLGESAEALARAAWGNPAVLGDAVGRRLGNAAGLLLFLDQAEELVTVSEPHERDAAEAALAVLAAGRPGVRVLTALRVDFLTRFAALPTLGDGLSRAIYFLRPLPPDRMREVIVGPAEASGLHFEPPSMVDDLVAASAQAGAGGLPLLQFALAELWEARDGRAGVIRRSALEAMGGVGGALAKHADALVLALPPAQRAEARRVLTRLVTLDDTRVRRTGAELGEAQPATRAALDALVRGRLLVALEDGGGRAFDLAHEVLVREWGTLRHWLAEDVERRAVHERLAVAAAEWRRTRQSREALWGARQLKEAAALRAAELGPHEAEFLRASGRAVRRGHWLRGGLALGLPLALAAAYGGALVKARREAGGRIDALVAEARGYLAEARAARAEAEALRAQAFGRFDAREREAGEAAWATALERGEAADLAFTRASRALEAAFAQDSKRADVGALLGQTLYDRAVAAEAEGRSAQEAELTERFALYDPTGELARRWNTPASLALTTSPPDARVLLERSPWRAKGAPQPPRDLGPAPVRALALERGSYLLTLSAPGRATLRYPFLAGRGEALELAVDLPPAAAVPEGYAYVPPGRFLFGSAGDEQTRRGFFDAVPLHPVRTEGYLVARREITYGDWLPFLESLPPAERARRTPNAEAKVGLNGALRLEERGGAYHLVVQPAKRRYDVRAGEPFVYQDRPEQAPQDWLKFPVTGVSADDVLAYADWLDRSGKLRGARLCTDYEWERAARGADGREFPHGDKLAPDDANFDETYKRKEMGPDEVGRRPASQSPFGLDDMTGNAFEWTRSSFDDQFVARGGSYAHERKVVQLVNRTGVPSTLRDATLGARICAPLQTPKAP
ncbi:MAG TPA: bifunctional serine/threonine-protein kinase/formylglycine-generating enzyme family protein [Polyangiaceae bacterium]|nr:bifunctional serine/threonine-protein kinase/formylglycine-generating enzyme family protein [Polyangiaceae bacterium]